jgi:hypothetical protein
MRDKEIGALPTTPKTASPQSKPTRVEKGQLWFMPDVDKRPHMVEFYDHGAGNAWFEGGGYGRKADMLKDGVWQFHGWAPGFGPSTAPIAPPPQPGERWSWVGGKGAGEMFTILGPSETPHVYRLRYEGLKSEMATSGSAEWLASECIRISPAVPSPGVAPGDLAFGPGSRDDSAMPNKCEWNIHNGMRPCGASDCIHLGAKASAPGGQGPSAAPSLPARRIEQNQASTLCHQCRLGDACTHGPKVREPWICPVDDFDLLPDA